MGRESDRVAAHSYIDVPLGAHKDDGLENGIYRDFAQSLRAQTTAPTPGRVAFDPTRDYVAEVSDFIRTHPSTSFGDAAEQIARGVDPFTIPLLPRYTMLGKASYKMAADHVVDSKTFVLPGLAGFYDVGCGLRALSAQSLSTHQLTTSVVMGPNAVMKRAVQYMHGDVVAEYVPHMLARHLDQIPIYAELSATKPTDGDVDSMIGQAVLWSATLTPGHAMKLFNAQEAQLPNGTIQNDVRGFMSTGWQHRPTDDNSQALSPFHHWLAGDFVGQWSSQKDMLKQTHMVDEMVNSSMAEYYAGRTTSGSVYHQK